MSDFFTVAPGSKPLAPQTGAAPTGSIAKSQGLVAVLVACCGQLEYTRLCVPSLLRFSRQPYELFFLEMGSLDGTAEYLEGLAAGAPVRMEVMRVAAEPDSTGASKKEEVVPIRGDFLALLNNDVIVTEGWLDSLIGAICSAPDIGMAAPMSNHGPASLLVDPVPYGLELGRGDSSGRRGNAQVETLNAFAKEWRARNKGECFEAESFGGACVLLKREVLQKLGAFPTRTPLGTFDTDNLSRRVRQSGYRLVGDKELFVHNFGSRLGNR